MNAPPGFARPAQASEDVEVAYPSAYKAWGLVSVLFITSLVSMLDRGIITLVVDPIRRDLQISDLQISLLQGLSFGIFYAIVGLPLGLGADRLPRRTLLAVGVSCWSVATFCGGFAASFGQLFAARLLVGLGEATLGPCAVSMISDMFPSAQRGKPIAVYLMGQAVSGGLSIMLIGAILKAAPAGAFAHVPVLAHLSPWRLVFVLCGLAGVAVVLLLLCFREPARRGARAVTHGAGAKAFAAYLGANWRVFAPFYAGYAVVAMSAYGLSAWSAAFLIRSHHLSAPVVGHWLGLTTVIAGALGALSAGQVVDLLVRRGVRDGKFRILIVASWFALPAALVFLAPNFPIALVMLGFGVAATPILGATMISAAQEMMPNDMRGLSVALMGFTNTVLGSTMGPLLIAAVAEHGLHDAGQIGRSMALVMIPAQAVASLLFVLGWRGFRAALANGGPLASVLRSA